MIDFVRIGIKIAVVVVALGIGVLFGWLIFRIREERCQINKYRCQTVTYQIADDGNILVTTDHGMVFLYDGTYILSYTEEAPGTCQRAVSDAPESLDDRVPIPDTKPFDLKRCTTYDATGNCTAWTTEKDYQPTVIQGSQIGRPTEFQPVFAIDAKTMKLIPGQTLCAKQSKYVLKDFENVEKKTSTHRVGEYGKVLNVYEIFDFLKKAGIFVPPS